MRLFEKPSVSSLIAVPPDDGWSVQAATKCVRPQLQNRSSVAFASSTAVGGSVSCYPALPKSHMVADRAVPLYAVNLCTES